MPQLRIVDMRPVSASAFEGIQDEGALIEEYECNGMSFYGGGAYEAHCGMNHNPINHIGRAIQDGYLVTQDGNTFTIHNEFLDPNDER